MLRKMLNYFNSIKYKFLFANLALVITFNLITIYFWNYRSAIDAQQFAGSYINEMLRVSNDNLEVALKDIYAIVNIAAKDNHIIDILAKKSDVNGYEYVQDDRTVKKYLLDIFTYKHYLNDIMVTDLNGRSFSNGNTISFDFIKKQKWYANIIQSKGDPVFIPPHYNSENAIVSPYQDDRVISIAEAVQGQNAVTGFVIADIRSQLLADIFASNLKNKVNVIVVDHDSGQIAFTADKDSLPKQYMDKDLTNIVRGISANEGSFYAKVGNEDALIVFRYSAITHWMMIGMVPKSELLEQFYQTRKGTLLLSILFCVIAVLVSILVSSFLTKSILRLSHAIKKIDKDHLHIQIKINSNDEIGRLSHQFNFMVQRIKDLVFDTKQKEREKRKAEIRALQAQINPHFLYNTLNTIKFLSVFHGADHIRDVSESLSRLMYINMQEKIFITIAEEIEYLKCYLNIQEYKYSNKFTASFTISEDILHLMIPKLLLQPFIENALIHGIAPLKAQGAISIKGFKEDNMIRFRIHDNGVGMAEEEIVKLQEDKNPTTNSVGIRNVISRIKMSFGESYGVSVMSETNLYTIVEVCLPAVTLEEVESYD